MGVSGAVGNGEGASPTTRFPETVLLNHSIKGLKMLFSSQLSDPIILHGANKNIAGVHLCSCAPRLLAVPHLCQAVRAQAALPSAMPHTARCRPMHSLAAMLMGLCLYRAGVGLERAPPPRRRWLGAAPPPRYFRAS